FSAGTRPGGKAAAARRNLPAATWTRERPHVDLERRRFIRRIRQPAPVWRKRRGDLDKRRSQEQLRLSEPRAPRVAFHRRREDVHATGIPGGKESQPLPIGRERIGYLLNLAFGQPLRLAGAIGTDPVQA